MAKENKVILIEYKNIFGEKVQHYCTIQKEFNEDLQRDEYFFVDVQTGYKIPYAQCLIKEADFTA